MSLKDDLNRPGDGGALGPIERLDLALARLAEAWAERWQARTAQGRPGLIRDLYLLALAGAVAYVALHGSALFLGVAALACVGSVPGQWRGALVEQIQLEAAGLPRQMMAWLNVGLLGLGLAGFLAGGLFLLLDVALSGVVVEVNLRGVLGGAALVALKVGDYLSRADPAPPRGGRPLPLAWAR